MIIIFITCQSIKLLHLIVEKQIHPRHVTVQIGFWIEDIIESFLFENAAGQKIPVNDACYCDTIIQVLWQNMAECHGNLLKVELSNLRRWTVISNTNVQIELGCSEKLSCNPDWEIAPSNEKTLKISWINSFYVS